MNPNGTYTYDSNNKMTDLGKTEQFSYTVAVNDTNDATTLTGTANSDLMISRGGNETITSNAVNDTLIYNLLNSTDARGGNGSDTWNNFTVNKSTTSGVDTDFIDIRGLLSDQTGLTDTTIKNILSSVVNNGNTVISIDRDGAGTTYSSTTLLTLNSVNTILDELLANKQIMY